MALNPPLTAAGVPLAVYGEFYILHRPHMKLKAYFETPSGSAKVESSGTVFLTTRRIVFVAKAPIPMSAGAYFTSLDIPITHLSGEKFNQPIFGANNLSGYVAPVPGMGLTGPCEFKLTFQEGGFTTFLHFLFRAIEETRVATAAAARGATLASIIPTGTLVATSAAYIDPSDPSTLYVTQPFVPPEPTAPPPEAAASSRPA